MKKLALFLAIVTILATVMGCFGSFADDGYENVFNPNTITKQRVSHLGILKTKTDNSIYEKYSVSDFIEVKPGDRIYFANADAEQSQSVPVAEFFNSNKEYIKFYQKNSVSYEQASQKNKGLAVGTFVVPENASYMKFNLLTDSAKNFVVTVNQEMDYELYCGIAGIDAPVFRTESPLYGKTVLFVGDSITEAAVEWNTANKYCIGWPGRIGYFNEMKYYNKGVSGASISNVRGNNLVVNQLMNNLAVGKKSDFIIMHGGVNDAWDSAPVGEMTDSFDTKDFNRDTFAGGLEYTFAYAKKNFPNAKLGYIINFRMTVSTGRLSNMKPYFDVAKQICDKWDIPYLDLYSDDNLNLKELKVNTYENLYDKIHPSSSGFDILTPYIQSWMETLATTTTPATPTPVPTPTPTPVPTPDDTKTPNTQTPDTSVTPGTTVPGTSNAPTTSELPDNGSVLFIAIGVTVAVIITGAVLFVIKIKR